MLVLATLGLLLARPCAASDDFAPLVALVFGVPAVVISILVLGLASFSPRAGFFSSFVLLIVIGIFCASLGGALLYLSLAITAIAFVVSIVRGSKNAGRDCQGCSAWAAERVSSGPARSAFCPLSSNTFAVALTLISCSGSSRL
jgi:hypothetical protein